MNEDTKNVEKVKAAAEEPAAADSEGVNQIQPVIDWLETSIGLESGWVQSNNLISAVVGIVGLLIIAYLLRWLVTAILKPILNRIPVLSQAHLTDHLPKPIFYSVLAAGVMLLTGLFELSPGTESIISKVVLSVLAFVWARFLMRTTNGLLLSMASQSFGKSKLLQEQSLPLFKNLVVMLVIIVLLYCLFMIWNIDMTAWLASAGIAGMAIGFAAKDTLSNLFSGVFIMADKPYKVGDYVIIDSGERGKVSHIGLRTTRLFTTDNEEISIPNAVIGNAKLVNETGGPSKRFRVRVPIGVAYGSDIDQVQELLLKVADECVLIVKAPEPTVRFRLFGPSSLDFELLAWVETPDTRSRAIHELNIAVYKTFNKNDIVIPFPQTDLHIKDAGPLQAKAK